jgi:predicted small lipoprotein YifL
MHNDDFLTASLRAPRLGWACLLLAACGGDLEPPPATGEAPKDKHTVEIPTKNPPACEISLADLETAPSPTASLVSDIAATDASLVAVDSGGGLRSLDGGASWSAVSLPITRMLAADSSGYVALGYDDVVYLGDSSGAVWQQATQGLPAAKVEHLAIGGGVPTAVAGDTGYRWNGASWDALEIPTTTVVHVATDGQRFLASSHEGSSSRPMGRAGARRRSTSTGASLRWRSRAT